MTDDTQDTPTPRTEAQQGSFEKPGMELEHAIGYCSLPGGLFYHPNGLHLIYAAGGTVVICSFNNPHEQDILTGHDGMITCLALGFSGRWVGLFDFDTPRIVLCSPTACLGAGARRICAVEDAYLGRVDSIQAQVLGKFC